MFGRKTLKKKNAFFGKFGQRNRGVEEKMKAEKIEIEKKNG
jgi:transcription antitermination factor NusA-like protein